MANWENDGPSKFEAWLRSARGSTVKDGSWPWPWISDAQGIAFASFPTTGRADVVTTDLSLYVECGFITTPAKVLDAVDSGSAILVVPYRDTVKLNATVGFMFERGVGYTQETAEGVKRKKLDSLFGDTNATEGLL